MPMLGWKPDPPKAPGERPDHDAEPTLRAAPPPPPSWSLRDYIPDILDQSAANSCVGNAIPQALRASHIQQGIAAPELASRLFGYYNSRAYHGSKEADEGTYLRTFFQALNKFGFCAERHWPYDLAHINDMPPWSAYKAGLDQSSPTVYQRISSVGRARVDDVKRAIAAGHVVCFGTDVTMAFASNQLGSAPLEPPGVGDEIAGGHAMCLAGYDGDEFDVVNSWGDGWGEDGWCRFSASYVAWPGTNDLWIVAVAPRYSE